MRKKIFQSFVKSKADDYRSKKGRNVKKEEARKEKHKNK
jgi:hypothetical protein